MPSVRSRSLSELATLKEEDPHDLRIEEGLPPLTVDTLQQMGPGSDSPFEPAAAPQAADANLQERDLDSSLYQKAPWVASSSAPHLLGK